MENFRGNLWSGDRQVVGCTPIPTGCPRLGNPYVYSGYLWDVICPLIWETDGFKTIWEDFFVKGGKPQLESRSKKSKTGKTGKIQRK